MIFSYGDGYIDLVIDYYPPSLLIQSSLYGLGLGVIGKANSPTENYSSCNQTHYPQSNNTCCPKLDNMSGICFIVVIVISPHVDCVKAFVPIINHSYMEIFLL